MRPHHNAVPLNPFASYYLDRFVASLRDPDSVELDRMRGQALAMLLESSDVEIPERPEPRRPQRPNGRRYRFKRKPCSHCGDHFQPTGGRSLVCTDCR